MSARNGSSVKHGKVLKTSSNFMEYVNQQLMLSSAEVHRAFAKNGWPHVSAATAQHTAAAKYQGMKR